MARCDLPGNRLLYGLTLASGILECLCFSGVVFGYASLVFVLKEDGYFGHLCVSVPVTGDNLTAAGEQKERKKVQSVLSNKDIPE